MGAGQFCTNPGLVLAVDSPALDRFVAAAAGALQATPGAVMLSPGIHASCERGVELLPGHDAVRPVARGCVGEGASQGIGALFETDAASFLADPVLGHEVFGSAALGIRGRGLAAIVPLRGY